MRISPTTLALLLVAVAAIGLVAGRMVAADDPGGEGPLASPQAVLDEPLLPLTLPVEDSPGTDLPTLPRFPGSIRTEYDQDLRTETREVDLEYLVSGSIDTVRTFYRGVFSRHEWQVIDVELAYGELRYILTDGTRDGVVELESRAGGVVEIDLHVLEPLVAVPAATPAPTPAPQAPAPEPAPQAPAPQPAPPIYYDDDDFDYDD